MNEHYVYLYRFRSGVPAYVGYGASPARATSHLAGSHNPDLAAWLGGGEWEVSIAGPYRDETEGRRVEAALISALSPRFNRVAGDGPAFVPVGVPPELSERPSMPALAPDEIARRVGGALFVFVKSGADRLSDGRVRFDPAHPDDEVIVEQVRGRWALGPLLDGWTFDPASSPRVLLGVNGPVKARFVVAALPVDVDAWGDPGLKVPGLARWYVPLAARTELDVSGLRGRRVKDLRFGRRSMDLHRWYDSDGALR